MFSAIALLVTISAGGPVQTDDSSDPIDVINVYAVVLGDARLTGRTAERTLVVLRDQTVDPSSHWQLEDYLPGPDFLDPRKRLAYASPTTVQSFLEVIAVLRPIQPSILRNVGASIGADGAPELRARHVTWGKFYERFPRATGMIEVSAVGFNRERDEDLVYVGRSCGIVCGEGFFVLLRLASTRWNISRIDRLWES